jgi:hypothetical protein
LTAGQIEVSIVTSAQLDIDGDLYVLDLSRWEGGRFVENAVVIDARRSGCRVENI